MPIPFNIEACSSFIFVDFVPASLLSDPYISVKKAKKISHKAYFFIIRRKVLIAFFETFNIVRDNAIDSNTLKKLDITVESMAQLKIMKIENTAILKKKAISLNLSAIILSYDAFSSL